MTCPVDIRQFPCLSDNYGFLVHDRATGATAAIDTPDAEAVNAELARAGWRLTHILNTHWHPDHAGGNEALKARWGCTVVAPDGEAARIPAVDRTVGEGDIVDLGAARARVLDTPGHTSGHIVYVFDDAFGPGRGAAFVGDTLFALGCGRLFEGTPAQMWASLSKLAALPAETVVYCAHEYTLANARFALSVTPDDPALRARAEAAQAARAAGAPTVPTSVAAERAANPFLRADEPEIAAAVGMAGSAPVDVFAEWRRRKDAFR